MGLCGYARSDGHGLSGGSVPYLHGNDSARSRVVTMFVKKYATVLPIGAEPLVTSGSDNEIWGSVVAGPILLLVLVWSHEAGGSVDEKEEALSATITIEIRKGSILLGLGEVIAEVDRFIAVGWIQFWRAAVAAVSSYLGAHLSEHAVGASIFRVLGSRHGTAQKDLIGWTLELSDTNPEFGLFGG